MSYSEYESVKLDELANNQSSDTCDSLMSSSNNKQGAKNLRSLMNTTDKYIMCEELA